MVSPVCQATEPLEQDRQANRQLSHPVSALSSGCSTFKF